MQETRYGLKVSVNLPYAQAAEKVTAALNTQGFGVLTQIDVQQTLKAKLARDFRKYLILAACHPAHDGQPPMSPRTTGRRTHAADADSPVIMHLHACEYSDTGYFGNEGSEIDLYVYGALHVAIPRYGEGSRAVTRTEPSRVSSPVPRGHKRRA